MFLIGKCTSNCVITYILLTFIFPCGIACYCTEILEEIGAVRKLVTEKLDVPRVCVNVSGVKFL